MFLRTLSFGRPCRGLAGALVAALFLSLIAPPAWAQGTQSQVVGRHRAFVVSVRGTVEVKAIGQNTWTAARANSEIRTGDRVRTAANSSCRLKVGDVGEFDVQASSEVTVGNLQQVRTTARAFFMFQRQITRDDVAVDLRSGDLRSSFHRQPGRVGNYNVHTPVAVAGVRGTKFELDLDGGRPWYERLDAQNGDGEELGLTLIVGEGEVGMTGPNWERTCRTGEQLNMRQGQMPGQPGPADPNRINEILGGFAGNNGDTGSNAGGDTSTPGAGIPSSSGDTGNLAGGNLPDTTAFETLSDTEDPFGSFTGAAGADDTFDTNAELLARVEELFAAYENKSEADFMELIDYDFAGVNNTGTALTYSTLASSIQGDMSSLSSVVFDPTVTSIVKVNGSFKVSVTWSGRFRFATVDTEVQRSGMTTELIFGNERPFYVEGWEGASPFGLTVPSTGVIEVPTESEYEIVEEIVSDPLNNGSNDAAALAPVVTSASGFITNRVITGQTEEFAPYRVTITGQNFEDGSRVQFFDDELGIWKDAEGFENGFSAITYVQNSTTIFLDFTDDLCQHFPDDALTEVHKWRVINSDGLVSNEMSEQVTVTPGPIEITNVTTSRALTDFYDATAGPITFDVEGYNFVLPLTVEITRTNNTLVLAQALLNPAFSITTPISVVQTQMGQPVRLQFQATQLITLVVADHFVNIQDARGQWAAGLVPVTSAPPPANLNWTTNQTLTSDFVVNSGQTLTIGSGVTVTGNGTARIVVDGQLTATGATLQNVPVEVGPTGSANMSSLTVEAGSVSQAAFANNGGTLTLSSSTINNASNTAVASSGGNTTLTGVTMTNNNTGIYVGGGNVSVLNPNISGGGTGIAVSSGTVTASGGSISNTTNEGITISGGQFTASGSPLTVSNAGSNNIRVGGSATVSLSNVTLTGATTGLYITTAAGAASVQAGSLTVNSSSGPAIIVQAGILSFSGGCSINGGASSAALSIENDANVSVTGSNTFSTASGAPAAVLYSTGASGTLTFGTGSTISGGGKAVEVAGNGTVNINAGVTVSGATGAGVHVDGGSASVLIGAATIQNNGGEGVLAGSCAVIDINGANILNNSGFGVARTGPGLIGGYVSLNNVQLFGNNGFSGQGDLNTSPLVANSSQYNYLTNPPNSVSNPR